MRFRLSILLLLVSLHFHPTAFAGANGVPPAKPVDPCEGERIEIDSDNYEVSIPDAFSHFRDHSCLSDTAYCLCFNVAVVDGVMIQVPNLPNLLLNSSDNGNRPIIIDGLRLNGFSGRMELRGSQPITFQNSTLSGCTDCLRVEGENHKLKDVTVTCGEKEEGIAGLTLIGEGHEIENVKVHKMKERDEDEDAEKWEWLDNCGVGIQIGEMGQPGNNIEIKKGELAGNGVGLWLANGSGNFVRKTSIFQNDFDGNGIFEAEEGILMEAGSNEGLLSPEIVFVEEESRLALSYPEGDAEGKEAYLKIRMGEMSGKAEIYLTGEKVDAEAEEEDEVGDDDASMACEKVVKTFADSKCKQGKKFLVKPKVASVKVLGGGYEQLLRFGMNKDLHWKVAVLVFHDGNKGSSTYSKTFVLNPKDIRGILSAAELDAPAAGGDLADAGSHVMTDAIPTDSADEDDSVERSGMGVIGPADGGSGGGPEAGGPAVISGGIGAAGGGAGGIKAGGCSLMSGVPKSLRAVATQCLVWLSLLASIGLCRSRKIQLPIPMS